VEVVYGGGGKSETMCARVHVSKSRGAHHQSALNSHRPASYRHTHDVCHSCNVTKQYRVLSNTTP